MHPRLNGTWEEGGSCDVLAAAFREIGVTAAKRRRGVSRGDPSSTGRSGVPPRSRPLETDRLRLRAPTGVDVPHVRRYAVRAAFYRHLDMPVPTPEAVERYLDAVIAAWEDPHGTDRVFAIEPKGAGRLAGLIRIGMDADDGRHGSVGFSLDPGFQGRGYATEALVELVRFGFEELGLRRIRAEVDTRNEKSWKVLERAGFLREKRMAGHRCIRGTPADSYLYSIRGDGFARTCQPLGKSGT